MKQTDKRKDVGQTEGQTDGRSHHCLGPLPQGEDTTIILQFIRRRCDVSVIVVKRF